MEKILIAVMMVLMLLIGGIASFLLFAEAPKQVAPQVIVVNAQPTTAKVYPVDGGNSELAWYYAEQDRIQALNERRSIDEQKDADDLFLRQYQTRNVRRSIDGEVYFGYIEEFDNIDRYPVNRGVVE